MADFPTITEFSKTIVSSASRESPVAVGIQTFTNNNLNTARAWPTANLALYIPIVIKTPTTYVKMFWVNGSTVGNNNVDVGVYTSEGNLIVSSGSTLTSGGTAIQEVDITDTTLLPSLYYLAMAMDGTTDTVMADNSAAPLHRSFGVFEQTTAFALPSSATFTGSTRAYLPLVGLAIQTLL